MIADLVREVKSGVDVARNPYFHALESGAMEHARFVSSQLQFRAAVIFFPRAMMALASRISDVTVARVLLHNIQDELSLHAPEHSHEQTFTTLLLRLGASQDAISHTEPGPEVRAFNLALHAACAFDDVNSALATLGMVEDLFSGISARIGRAIVQRGWLPAEQVIHYPTHEIVDVGHAEAFYRCAASAPEPVVLRGLRLGAHIFMRLYEDLQRR